jgi:hypothetical protein
MAAAVIEEAMALLGPVYPRDRSQRKRILASIERSVLEPLNERFDAVKDSENGGFEAAANAFARRTLP